MKVIFISNFFNHHQKAIADELYRLTGGECHFFATKEMSAERKKLGWGIDIPSYVVEAKQPLSVDKQKEIEEADVVIFGGGESYEYIKTRIKQRKITFLFTERLYKKKMLFLRRCKSLIFRMPKWRKKNAYLLCAGGFVYDDFRSLCCFKGKAYRWGYFPPFQGVDDVEKGLANKRKNSLLWCARFLDWKHPETAIEVAKRLREDGYDFTLRMLGTGELLPKIQKRIEEENLQEYVYLTGGLPFEEARAEMRSAEIFMFTSDREEGWGAVLNESMNAAMAVVSSHEIGATPYLVKDGENGLVYEDGNVDELYQKVKYLLDNPQIRQEMAKKAYATIADAWNGEEAARRIMTLAENLLLGKDTPYEEGPGSKAPLLKDNWYPIKKER